MSTVIEIRNLGKEYSRQAPQPYISLRDTINNSVKKIFNPRKQRTEKFWALKNINLDIEQGDRIGIVGRNGAGKSTLLKIISRITPPTTGNAVIRGRVGSLLEVGTGFHPELTGRENIYLNGSILGLKKAEITKQLEAIIDFSGVEKFIDTPLRHYSSGMQLRLAFSVAAHLEPEILLIDEVLAVGDMEFQKKCMGKMEEVSKRHGRTIIFVSHNLRAVNELCEKAILLDKGEVVLFDEVKKVTSQYINSLDNKTGSRQINRNADLNIFVSDIITCDENGEPKYTFSENEKIGIKVTVTNKNWPNDFIIGLGINSAMKGRVLIDLRPCKSITSPSSHNYIAWLPTGELTPNAYSADISILDGNSTSLDILTDIISFEIALANSKFEGLGYDYGVISKELIWQDSNQA